jgi:hypothetical protein
MFLGEAKVPYLLNCGYLLGNGSKKKRAASTGSWAEESLQWRSLCNPPSDFHDYVHPGGVKEEGPSLFCSPWSVVSTEQLGTQCACTADMWRQSPAVAARARCSLHGRSVCTAEWSRAPLPHTPPSTRCTPVLPHPTPPEEHLWTLNCRHTLPEQKGKGLKEFETKDKRLKQFRGCVAAPSDGLSI